MTDDNRDGVKDFSDPKTVLKGKKRHKQKRLDDIADLEAVMETPQGRRVLWRILDESKFLAENMFTGNSTTFFNLGQHKIGVWLYKEIMAANPKQFLSMMEAQLKKDENND